MSYQTALFCQFFEQELRVRGSFRQRIRRALRRLSPTIKFRQLRLYIEALFATMIRSGRLYPDWRERVRREH